MEAELTSTGDRFGCSVCVAHAIQWRDLSRVATMRAARAASALPRHVGAACASPVDFR